MLKKRYLTLTPDLLIWRRDGKLWYTDKKTLLAEIARSPNSDKIIRRKMGWGYHLIAEALAGKRLNIWEVRHIEMGLSPDSPAEFALKGLVYRTA